MSFQLVLEHQENVFFYEMFLKECSIPSEVLSYDKYSTLFEAQPRSRSDILKNKKKLEAGWKVWLKGGVLSAAAIGWGAYVGGGAAAAGTIGAGGAAATVALGPGAMLAVPVAMFVWWYHRYSTDACRKESGGDKVKYNQCYINSIKEIYRRIARDESQASQIKDPKMKQKMIFKLKKERAKYAQKLVSFQEKMNKARQN